MLNTLKQFSQQLISPDSFIRKRYATFQRLLESDRECHSLLAALEDIYYSRKTVDINRVRNLYQELSTTIAGMLTDLYQLAPGRYRNLSDYYKKIDFYARFALAPPKCDTAPPYILPVTAAYQDDRQTGGKGLHLSHLSHKLGLPVPAGFIISTSAWNLVQESNALRPKINRLLAGADINSQDSLSEISASLQEEIRQAVIPRGLAGEIVAALEALEKEFPARAFAVRSSAVGEDSSLSFAGQYCSLLNVGKGDVLEAYREILAGKFSPEAIFYRVVKGLDDEETTMAAIVLVMVDARLSGVIATGNPADPDQKTSWVHSVPGLGDNLMAGQVMPFSQEIRRTSDQIEIPRQKPDGGQPGLTDDQLLLLADWADKIVEYYKKPQEIEWSCDGAGSIYLLQARHLQLENKRIQDQQPDLSRLSLLFQAGLTAAPGICSGPAVHFPAATDQESIADGSLLVCEVTPPSLVKLLPRLAGVIARFGSSADHFSSVAREFAIPVLVQAGDHCRQLKNGELLTLWADRQSVYLGGTLSSRKKNAGLKQGESSPFYQTLKMVINFTSPLSLTDPSSDDFCPENCRSLHDILRFIHEKSVQAMFIQSTDSLLRKPKGAKLQTEIPLQIHIIDVGDGLSPAAAGSKEVSLSELRCLPLQALWRGLSHPGVVWRERSHFDWKSYDSIALAGGVSAKSDSSLVSFCLISSEYLNVNIRFGYHFTLLDCLCGGNPQENYILLRFAGGGGNSEGKDLRLSFIAKALTRLHFNCEQTGEMLDAGELLDARLMRYDREITADRLDQVGRLLGAVRLLDMVLTEETMVETMVEDFFRGVYDFSNE